MVANVAMFSSNISCFFYLHFILIFKKMRFQVSQLYQDLAQECLKDPYVI